MVCIISFLCLLSCGIEAFYYIDYIPQGDMDGLNRATIRLPSDSAEGYSNYFSNFIIFYRIYISGANRSGIVETADERTLINSTLNSDYNSLYSYTDTTSTSVSTSNLETVFYSNRKYYKLELEGADITNVLGRGSLGQTLKIWFDTNNGVNPTLTLNNGTPYTLQRAANLIQPLPNRYFLNDSELFDTANVTNELNADVATNTNTSLELRYTYASMYIAAIGQSLAMPPQTIYSQPTFLGVFRLAESTG